jgi:hypothetical protein
VRKYYGIIKLGQIRFSYILIPIVQKEKILIPKGQKERKSVTFAIPLRTIWYDREKVSNFEIVVAKLKETLRNVICHTLPERSVGASSGAQRHKLAHKDFYLDQNTIPLTLLSHLLYLAYLWYLQHSTQNCLPTEMALVGSSDPD